MTHAKPKALRAAEFFAGIGLVRRALESADFKVVFANDIEPDKHALYAANFDASHFVLGDVRLVKGAAVPDVDLATASFPCTDLSLAGNRAGLDGEASGMFWEFARVLSEMGKRRPNVVLLENVVGFASSRAGADMTAAVSRLNELGYACDVFVIDARRFVPQSRPRMFIVGSRLPVHGDDWTSELRPVWVQAFAEAHPSLKLHALPMKVPPASEQTIADTVQRLPPLDERWWDAARQARFIDSLSEIQGARLRRLQDGPSLTWATAYRRTRNGKATWEIRADALSGCLRTARGGSSKQAVVEAGRGTIRVRWMTPREYARLQGAADFIIDGVSDNAALFGFGDAVCVPVVAWIAKMYLRPLLEGKFTSDQARRTVTA